MKFLIASIAALMTVQGVKLQREAPSTSVSRMDGYSTTEILDNQ